MYTFANAFELIWLYINVLIIYNILYNLQEELKKILYADDLAVVADNKEDLQKNIARMELIPLENMASE